MTGQLRALSLCGIGLTSTVKFTSFRRTQKNNIASSARLVVTGHQVLRRASGSRVDHPPALKGQSTSVLCIASLLFDAASVEGNCPCLRGVQECELVTRTKLREDTCVVALA